MSFRWKRSVTFDRELEARIETAATGMGLTTSAWLARCAEDRLINEDGLLAMQEYSSMFGPLTLDALMRADADLDAAFAVVRSPVRVYKPRYGSK